MQKVDVAVQSYRKPESLIYTLFSLHVSASFPTFFGVQAALAACTAQGLGAFGFCFFKPVVA